jgi:hypothetical protein
MALLSAGAPLVFTATPWENNLQAVSSINDSINIFFITSGFIAKRKYIPSLPVRPFYYYPVCLNYCAAKAGFIYSVNKYAYHLLIKTRHSLKALSEKMKAALVLKKRRNT